MSGPDRYEQSAGLTSDIPQGTTVEKVSVSNRTVTINFNSAFYQSGTNAQMLGRIAQVVYTMTQFANVGSVAFQLGNSVIESLGNVKLGKPIGRASVSGALPPLLVESPALSDKETSPLQLQAVSAFSGVYSVQLYDQAGKQLLDVVGTTLPWATIDESVPYSASSTGTGKLVVSASPRGLATEQVANIAIQVGP